MSRPAADYAGGVTKASLSALLEIVLALGTFREALVLIGGWAPYFLIERHGRTGFSHVGSIDIDMAVNPEVISQDGYATIVELLKERGYLMRTSATGEPIPFSFSKDITLESGGRPYSISIDFLTNSSEESRGHRHRLVQTLLPARIARGCEIAFQHHQLLEISGFLPGNGKSSAQLNVLDIPGCIGMKGVVLGERYREKDAYDIFSVVSQCLKGPAEVGATVKPFLEEKGMRLGVDNIKQKFRAIDAEGPSWVGEFLHSTDAEQKRRAQAESYVLINRFLRELN